jgi:hypothetical protein
MPAGVHPTVALTPGGCVRGGSNLGNSNFCGEALVGLDWASGGRVHLSFEGGVGIMGQTTFGYPDLGVAQSSGGFYGVVRSQVGYDVTDYYFFRVGAQGKGTYLLNWFTPGVQAVGDIGTRFFDRHLDVGARVFVGVDGVATGGLGGTSSATLVMAYGYTLNLRYSFFK